MKTLQIACFLLISFLSESATSQATSIFDGADLELGRKLLNEKDCATCHSRKFGGDGSAVYRPEEKVTSPAALRGMVEGCNIKYNYRLFPDEVTAISAYLNQQYYKFVK